MNIEDIPFNRLIGLQREPDGGQWAVSLPPGSQYHNHLGIVHAAAQLAVAEAASGDWMLRHFGARAVDFIAVVRRMETKFKQPARGKILCKATVSEAARALLAEEMATRRAMSFTVRVDVHDATGAHALTGTVEWFITRRSATGEGDKKA